ncbi:MAG: ATP-binding cassette domain-containing protein [Candidatus Theseobacter exili]|nr:ATP-binding cassette domain-containing protein [Candidatus Theseobacter exili]
MASDITELEIENLSAGYGKREVLNDLNLTITKGEITAVVGQNGAGKSTLLKVIMGFLPPKRGNIIFDNKNVTMDDVKKKVDGGIYYFMQGGRIFPSMTVQENLHLAGHNITDQPVRNRVSDMISLFFPEKVDTDNGAGFMVKNASHLSGGERHKLALMMTLMNMPRLLLLDEPSAGLSPQNANKIYEILADFVARFKMTVLLIEQNVKLAVENSDRIYLLKGGKIERNALSKTIRNNDGSVHEGKMDEFFFGKELEIESK